MGLFLILSPFAVLSALMMVAPATVALFAAASISTLLVGIDALRRRSPKMLQIGAALSLAIVGSYVLLIDTTMSSVAARAAVDVGLLGIALGSLALRFPFTLQYARETVDDEIAARPEFKSANYILTWVWTAAFMTMLVADFFVIYAPWLPLWTGIAAAFVARSAAAFFTQWYAGRRRAKVADERARLIGAIPSVSGRLA